MNLSSSIIVILGGCVVVWLCGKVVGCVGRWLVVWEGGNCGWLCGKVVIVGGCVGRW